MDILNDDQILRAITAFNNQMYYNKDSSSTLAAHFAEVYLTKLKKVRVEHFESNFDQILSEVFDKDGKTNEIRIQMLFLAMIMLCLKKTTRF